MSKSLVLNKQNKMYLLSYRPICINALGVAAMEKYGFPPFVDNSCRREPDFENPFPSITSLCRKDKYVPRLSIGDVVVYMTVGSSKKPFMHGHHLVAVLQVIEKLESHQLASEWYVKRKCPLPKNCIVTGNPPLQYDMTAGGSKKERGMTIREYQALSHEEKVKEGNKIIRRWNGAYKLRANDVSDFVITEPIYVELYSPIVIEKQLRDIFGGIPQTQRYKPLSYDECKALLEIARVKMKVA